MDRQDRLREIREAIDAGNRALRSLDEARAELNSASNFGIADMLGFDLIGGIGKHVKLRAAKDKLEQARYQVLLFQRELIDVRDTLNFQIEIGGFLTLADFFLDGILADVLVQSKISQAKRQVDQASDQINCIVEELLRMERGLLE